MLPIISGIKITKLNILIYAMLLFPVAISPFFLSFSGEFYLIIATILTGYYVFISYQLFKAKSLREEKKFATK